MGQFPVAPRGRITKYQLRRERLRRSARMGRFHQILSGLAKSRQEHAKLLRRAGGPRDEGNASREGVLQQWLIQDKA